jgi:hypothetical protein
MQTRFTFGLAAFAAAGLTFGATAANAALITPTSATADSAIDSTRTIDKTIDGSDLFNDSDKSEFTGTLTEANSSSVVHGAGSWSAVDGYWLGGSGNTLTFDLGGSFDIESIYLWNYAANSDNSDRGIKTFDISFSTDGGSSYSTAESASSLGISDFNEDVIGGFFGNEGYNSVQQRDFTSAQSGVTNIRFSNLTTNGGNLAGLEEIRFGAVPEPASLALMGLGGLMLIGGRRRRQA